ncbi:MAG: type II toxin-antitoxin system RelE/ParE family toxin [Archaeoglobaceae archaeon]|nr:type II toxin-antitoxin system RelE/ParE family toxin [Archaeoglobaceae archaeon]MDW8118505.1 type II toxin-antitoxin system RelE/ParE family toxin [Archaeoglobaceae archaeon]
MEKDYDLELSKRLIEKLEKLKNKDISKYNAVVNKILQIAENPKIGKPLKGRLKGKRRVHVGSFVLIYQIDDKNRKVIFLQFAHHDEAYR